MEAFLQLAPPESHDSNDSQDLGVLRILGVLVEQPKMDRNKF